MGQDIASLFEHPPQCDPRMYADRFVNEINSACEENINDMWIARTPEEIEQRKRDRASITDQALALLPIGHRRSDTGRNSQQSRNSRGSESTMRSSLGSATSSA